MPEHVELAVSEAAMRHVVFYFEHILESGFLIISHQIKSPRFVVSNTMLKDCDLVMSEMKS
jgi:hypothetical protein